MKRLSLDQIGVDTTVQPVSQNRMTDVRHVYPDLVCPPCFQQQFHQGVAALQEAFANRIVSYRRSATFHNAPSHILRIRTPDRKIDGAVIVFQDPLYDGQITFLYQIFFHLTCVVVLAVCVFGYDEKTGSVHVEAVDEADFEGLSRMFHVIHKSIGHGACGMTFGRMDDEPRLLVDDQQIVIFIYWIQWYRLRLEKAFFFRKIDADHVADFWLDPAGRLLIVEHY